VAGLGSRRGRGVEATWAQRAGTWRAARREGRVTLGAERFCIGRQRTGRVVVTERHPEADDFEFLDLGDHLLPGCDCETDYELSVFEPV
jgi:hypothetical protein